MRGYQVRGCLIGSVVIAFAFNTMQARAEEANAKSDRAIVVSRPSESLDSFSLAKLSRGHSSQLNLADNISLKLGSSDVPTAMPVKCSSKPVAMHQSENCLVSAGDRRGIWSYVSLDVRFSEDLAVYARTGRAYRIGAGQLRAIGIVGSVDTSISDRPQVRFEHEAGIRGELFDDKIAVNFAAYYNKVQAAQETLTFTTPTGTRYSSFINPTTVRNMGLETDVTFRPFDAFSVYGSVAANREKFKICAGGFCPGHARDIMQTQVNVGATYHRKVAIGTLGFNLNCNWTGRGSLTSSNSSRLGKMFSRRSATTIDARASLDFRNSPIEIYASPHGATITNAQKRERAAPFHRPLCLELGGVATRRRSPCAPEPG